MFHILLSISQKPKMNTFKIYSGSKNDAEGILPNMQKNINFHVSNSQRMSILYTSI
jgi:hypothetical protein